MPGRRGRRACALRIAPGARRSRGADGRRPSGDAADILEFQVAMLEDESLADAGLRRDRWRAPTRPPPGPRRSTPRSPTTRRPRTTISAPAAPTCATSATASCARSAGAAPTTAAPPGAVLFGRDLTPDRFLADRLVGRAAASCCSDGSPPSHVAMLARARGVPMLVGVGGARRRPATISRSLDAEHGRRHRARPTPRRGTSSSRPRRAARAAAATRRAAQLRRAGGHRRRRRASTVLVNVADPADVDAHRYRRPATASG